MIKNVVFDFGGVLVNYDFTAFFARVLGSREQGEAFMHRVLTDERNDLLDKGDRSVGEYVAEWKQRWPEYAAALDAFDSDYTDIFTGEVAGMRELMATLKAGGYRLLGLSNWSAKVFDVMDKYPAVFAPLDGFLVSHQVHMLKPHREIYETFCRRFGVAPADCVFTDDKAANIEGARAAGMHAIVFKDAVQLRRDLARLLRPSSSHRQV